MRQPEPPRSRPALVVIGGLPATGKSTVGRAVARRLGASYLRIDTTSSPSPSSPPTARTRTPCVMRSPTDWATTSPTPWRRTSSPRACTSSPSA
ncbi:zeta toxin family protein [Streptomyces albidoflavus]|uniref:zeta toxin family protein n=1 Tax=Streptomyces TaxID=1883 RepID=UPI001EF6B1F0|nr:MULTISPECIES: zeta toxin family protein [Streptomyces]WJK65721.1 zeta toxin family protein [Streptomyces albidoflavus]WSD56183.1 zeta toxin family protein [Streptomyces albidoflavus]WSU14363.1 zeta toxin family protein [Streptomyces albidoflavus]WTC34671.1 zeta toxin family protein [Streptomyces albidoflavus]WTC44847.1 zeta toxin family protein [Streptomyces albidoflavus]